MKFYNLFEGIYWSISQKREGKTKNQKKISKTADYYRMLHQIPMDVPCRFDVVAETPEEIRVYANAFYYQGSGW